MKAAGTAVDPIDFSMLSDDCSGSDVDVEIVHQSAASTSRTGRSGQPAISGVVPRSASSHPPRSTAKSSASGHGGNASSPQHVNPAASITPRKRAPFRAISNSPRTNRSRTSASEGGVTEDPTARAPRHTLKRATPPADSDVISDLEVPNNKKLRSDAGSRNLDASDMWACSSEHSEDEGHPCAPERAPARTQVIGATLAGASEIAPDIGREEASVVASNDAMHADCFGVPAPEAESDIVEHDDRRIAKDDLQRYTEAELEAVRVEFVATLPFNMPSIVGTPRSKSNIAKAYAKVLTLPALNKIARRNNLLLPSVIADRPIDSPCTFMWEYLLPLIEAEDLDVLFQKQDSSSHFDQWQIESNWGTVEDCYAENIDISQRSRLLAHNGFEYGARRASVSTFGQTPSSTTDALKDSGLLHSGLATFRNRQPFMWTNKVSGANPIRDNQDIHDAYLLMEMVNLLVWLELGGGTSLILSGETSSDLRNAIDELVVEGLVRHKTGRFSRDGGAVNYSTLVLASDDSKTVLLLYGFGPTMRMYTSATRWLHLSADLTILIFRLIRGDNNPTFSEYHASALSPGIFTKTGLWRAMPDWIYRLAICANDHGGKEKTPVQSDNTDTYKIVTSRYAANRQDVEQLCADKLAQGWKNIFCIYSVYLSRLQQRTVRDANQARSFSAANYIDEALPSDNVIQALFPEAWTAIARLLSSSVYSMHYIPAVLHRAATGSRTDALRLALDGTSEAASIKRRDIKQTYAAVYEEWLTRGLARTAAHDDNSDAYDALLEYEQLAAHELGASSAKWKTMLEDVVGLMSRLSRKMQSRARLRQRRNDDDDIWCRQCGSDSSSDQWRPGPYGPNGAMRANTLCNACAARNLEAKKVATKKCKIADCSGNPSKTHSFQDSVCRSCYQRASNYDKKKKYQPADARSYRYAMKLAFVGSNPPQDFLWADHPIS